ncbi:hypothetical protein C2G38_2209534 [Gigaspora rosea]|uniref:Uncharacterized protein n=1 Tax=Gigaspora rosea TaxID=44941 RepID=A0A397UI58_9GLOM|nr:hypothetical protein C2G38_2209534 [Gigaspora rosea]
MKVTKKSIQEKAEEFSNFPADYTIKYKTSKRSYKYYIVKAGIYPPESELAYTLKPNQYPIPDKYIVETTYGKNEQTVICYINYIAKRPHYKIIFGLEKEDFVCSILSPTAAANNYLKPRRFFSVLLTQSKHETLF